MENQNKTVVDFLFEILDTWKSGRKITITISCEPQITGKHENADLMREEKK